MTGTGSPDPHTDPHTVDAGAYVVGALDPAARMTFERHLRDCGRCSRAVAELAGLPALLAAVPADVAESLLTEGDDGPGPTPPGLLDGVMARAGAEQAGRRRRRLLTVAAAAAVAMVLTVAGLLVVAGGRDAGPQSADVQVVAMQPVDDGPLAVTARLASVPWGTRIELDCRYEARGSVYATPPTYALVVRDDAGATEQVATWRAVTGRKVTVEAASAVPRDRIATLEVQTADGRTVLRVDR